jgi:LysR family glycine cleavage system transcriptional activator
MPDNADCTAADSVMHRRSPPWGAIEAFVVASRLGSFKAAAQELGVSPSAFSRRIQALETHVGARLFDRGDTALRLTKAGRRYLNRLEPGYAAIRAATDWMAPSPGRRPLRVGVSQSFAIGWLLPRLQRFHDAWPDIEVTLHTRAGNLDLAGGAADIAILFGDGQWAGMRSRRLLDTDAMVVGAPALAGASVAELGRARQLEMFYPPDLWRYWLDATGATELAGGERLYFDSGQVMYEAAARGLGIAIGIRPLVDPFLKSGRLVPLHERTVRLTGGHYVAALPAMMHEPPVRAFWRWILEERSGDG